MSQQLFSSESVTEGHPDKVCDRISDAILDALLDVDPRSRVAVETMAATGLIHVAGEVTTEAYVEIPEIVRREILSIGYDSSRVGFDGASCGVSISLDGRVPILRAALTRRLRCVAPRAAILETASARATRASCLATLPPTLLTSCRLPSGWRTAWPSASPTCANRASSRAAPRR